MAITNCPQTKKNTQQREYGVELISSNVLTNSAVFPVMSKERRGELTKFSESEPDIAIEVPVNREYVTSDGCLVIKTGPELCAFDGTVASLLSALYIWKKEKNCLLHTTYAELRKLLALPNGDKTNERLRRSLNRLQDSTFRIFKDRVQLWGRTYITDFDTQGAGRSLQLVIKLNEKWISTIREEGHISTQLLSAINKIKGQRRVALYRYFTLHKEQREFSCNATQLYSLLKAQGGEGDLAWGSLSPSQRKKWIASLKGDLKHLIVLGLINPSSKALRGGIFCISLPETEK